MVGRLSRRLDSGTITGMSLPAGGWRFTPRFHVYVAIREDIMSRQSLISTMISGYRMFKD